MYWIVKVPSLVLTTPSKPVERIDKKLLEFIGEMKRILVATDNPKGVGLAAPQVGQPLQVFITKPWPRSPFTVFINPEIVWISKERTKGVPQRKNKLEGCLSLPNIWGIVHRSQKIKLRYQTLIPGLQTTDYRLQTKIRTFSGFLATIIQHEMDHLDGVLFTQRVLEQKEKLFKLVKDKEGKNIFEPISI